MNQKFYFFLTNLLIITIITFIKSSPNNNEEILKSLYIDFDTSMQSGFSPEEYALYLGKKQHKPYIPFLKKLYEQSNFLKKIEEHSTKKNTIISKIPKKIHQIWLGSPFPECYKKYQESWLRHHPTWEYKLWTDADLPTFNLINKKAFDNARNYSEKSDIWRYEIIERYGGVYVDTDFECLQPLDILSNFYEFYTGIITINRSSLLNGALIGAIPHHPILKKCVADANLKKYGKDQMYSTGPIYFSNIILELCQNDKNLNLDTIILLPPTYLYPLPRAVDQKKINNFLLPSSFAVHYWASKWNMTPQQ